jgi:iron complex outermembrane recepter protein
MKSILSVMFLAVLGTAATAQKISGSLLEANGNPAQYATVTLHQAADSSLVKGTLTADNGAFDFLHITPGRYFVKADLIGSGQYSGPVFETDQNDKTLENITLQEAPKELAQVTVTARRPPVEIKADKTVLNVEGTVNSTGLNALELLRKAPGVVVDNNENVQVKGKNNVRIQIDGRDTPLDGKDLAALLKGMQASDIANIEIISNPSAKYDAAGNAGIINLKLRKNEAVYGQTFKAGGNLSLNHRSEKFNIFGSYNNHTGNWHNTQNFFRQQNNQGFDQQNKEYNESRWNSLRTGADWMINSKHTVGVLLNGNYNPGDWHSNGVTRITNASAPDSTTSLLFATNDIDQDRAEINGNINYRFADTSGHSLNIDFDRGAYRIRGRSYQPNIYRSPDEVSVIDENIYRNYTPTNINITTAKVDYEQRLLKGTLGIGAKYSGVKTDNTFDFYNIEGGVSSLDTTVSNRFKYDERTSAAYINYNRMFGKKLNVQTGLRLEHTEYMGDLISYNSQNGGKVENDYTKLFPSAAITYTFTKKLGLNATYSRRIDRPSYQDLNPFEFKLDELTFQRGNPRLRPQFTNSFEIAPTFQGFPIISLGYSKTNDVFTQVLGTDSKNPRATFITNENIADQENLTATLNIPTPLAKWWEGFISVTAFQSKFKAQFDNLGFGIDEVKFTAMNLYAEQTAKLGSGWSVQLSGWYNTPAYWGTLRSGHQGAMDLGIQKKILDGKGDLRLRFGDILHTAGWNGENIFTPGLSMTARGTWESRTVTLNFSYRFGSSEVRAARQRKTGLEDESRRVKGK